MLEKLPLIDRLKSKQEEKSRELEVLIKAIKILEENTDWAILMEAMNH